jgi:hypothetical protein
VLSPVNIESYGNDTDYNGQVITGSDGLARFQRLDDVLTTGQRGYLRRIVMGDPISSGSGLRCENSFSGAQTLQNGVDYWWAFALQPLAGEWHGDEPGTSNQILFQVHQYVGAGADGPSFSIATQGDGNRLVIDRIYGTTDDRLYTGPTNSRPADGVWTRFMIHLRFSPDGSQAPVIQIWQDETAIVDASGSSALIGADGETYYTKIGFYKWRYTAGDFGANTTRAAYYSDLFFSQGSATVDNAKASLVAFH